MTATLQCFSHNAHYHYSDLTITTEKLMKLFVSLDPEMVDKIGGKPYLSLSLIEIDRIEKGYQSSTKRKEAYLDLYAHQHPCPSWIEIAGVLRWFNLHPSADLVENTYVKGKQAMMQDTGSELYLFTKIASSS